MKYIAVFDIPDDCAIGCAVAKMCKKDGEIKKESDFENVYAQIEPLANEKAAVLERFNVVDRVISDLGLHNAYDMPGFWTHNRENYTVIPTKWHKGYMQALKDVERDIRNQLGFSERDNVVTSFLYGEETI